MKNKINPLAPTTPLLIKLGSALIHAEELIETKFKNLDYDIPAFETISKDAEVVAWVKAMGPLLPLKRSVASPTESDGGRK